MAYTLMNIPDDDTKITSSLVVETRLGTQLKEPTNQYSLVP